MVEEKTVSQGGKQTSGCWISTRISIADKYSSLKRSVVILGKHNKNGLEVEHVPIDSSSDPSYMEY